MARTRQPLGRVGAPDGTLLRDRNVRSDWDSYATVVKERVDNLCSNGSNFSRLSAQDGTYGSLQDYITPLDVSAFERSARNRSEVSDDTCERHNTATVTSSPHAPVPRTSPRLSGARAPDYASAFYEGRADTK